MKRRTTLPLGVDVGACRTRIALLESDPTGRGRIIAVATRPTGVDPAVAIADAYRELGTPERRCVLALAAPDSSLQTATFPPLGRRERQRAARYEATRAIEYPIDEALVRVMSIDRTRSVVAIARRAALEARVDAARRAGLRVVAVDDAALALLRAFPHDDAIVDVGERGTTLVIRDEPIPSTRRFAVGGVTLTDAVAASLGVDYATAEHRKRSVGLGGAGEHARDHLVAELASAFIDVRASARIAIATIALVGNGAKLSGFGETLERAVAIPVRLGTLPGGIGNALADDVVRAASPDWGLAYGLSLWEVAA